MSKKEFVIEQITNMIKTGNYPPGEQLPSEPELEKLFNVSRGTVRLALSDLALAGIVARRSGAGTFVLRNMEKEPRVISFRKQISKAGMVPSTKVLEASKIMAASAEEWIWRAFLVSEDTAASTPLYRINRLRYGNNTPLAQQIIYLRVQDFQPNLLEVEDFTQSIFNLYDRFHRKVTMADERILARLATPDEITQFQLADLPIEKQIVYVRERVSYDQENMPLEVMTSIDRGDYFKGYRYRITEGDPIT